MRNSKPGLGDLRRLQKEAALARQQSEAQRRDKDALAAQDLKTRQSDARLFARVVEAVQPLHAGGRILHPPSAGLQREQVRTLIAQRRQRATGEASRATTAISDIAGAPEDAGADLAFTAPGVGPDILRRLRQAFWPVGAELDLHGHTADKARDALARFIDQSRACGTRCVCVIHGVGHGSARGQPVLRTKVAAWLSQLPGIQAYATAPPAHGGRGAVLVLLRLP